MTFDDGILTVYNVTNTAQAGDRPVMGLEEKAKYYFGYDRIGVTRLYLAKQAAQEVSAGVNIPGWNDVKNTDVVLIPEPQPLHYQVADVQPELDENGLRIMKLTLERTGQKYEVPTASESGASDGD